jgi:hypothetical protein
MSRRLPASSAVRVTRIVAVAVLIGVGISQAGFRIADWSLSDMDAYWNAALRLRAGDPLYPPLADVSASDVYRYAPWFATAWVPLTFLPKGVVALFWSAALLVAVALCLRPLIRRDLTSAAAACFFGSFLIWGASVGNVGPLLVAGLMHSTDRRSGPVAIGVAASLKAVPILFLLVYLGRRQWDRVGVGIIVALALTASFVFVDLTAYPTAPGDAPSPFYALSPILFGVFAAGLAVAAVVLAARRSPFDRFAAGCAALGSLPRITLLDLPMLLVGIRPDPADKRPPR